LSVVGGREDEMRTSNFERRTVEENANIEHRTPNIQRRTEEKNANIEHRTPNIERRTSNVEHPTSNGRK